MRARTASAVLLLVGALAAACSSGGGGRHAAPGPASYAQASSRIHAYMRESMQAFPPEAGLRLLTPDVDVPCSDNDGAPPSTPVSILPGGVVTGVGAGRYDGMLDSFVAFWRKRGGQVGLDQRPTYRYVVMRRPDIDYELGLQVSADGHRLSLQGNTPCVPPRHGPARGPG